MIMGLFGSKSKTPTYVPELYRRGLRGFGEHLAGVPTNYNDGLTADLTMINFAQSDPAGYVELLAQHIGGSDSGAYCLGAAETVASVLKLEVSTPAWDQIVDGAADYLRSLGIPYSKTKPYMQARWTQTYTPAEW
jgi:hypothetical protein